MRELTVFAVIAVAGIVGCATPQETKSEQEIQKEIASDSASCKKQGGNVEVVNDPILGKFVRCWFKT